MRRLLHPDPVAAVIIAVESFGLLRIGLAIRGSIGLAFFALAVGGLVVASGIAAHLLEARVMGLVGCLVVGGVLTWFILAALSPPRKYHPSLSAMTPLIAMELGLAVAAVLLVVGIIGRNRRPGG